MLGRRFIIILIGIVLILAGVTCALGYFVLRPLFLGTDELIPEDVNSITAIVKGVNGSNSSIVIQRTRGYDLIRYGASTNVQRQGSGLSASINEIYQCTTVIANGGRDNTEFRATQIIIVPVSEAPAGQYTGTVIVTQTELRPIPDPRVPPSGTITEGTRLSLHGRCGTDSDWLAVTAPGGIRGWVDREFVEVDDTTLGRLPWLSLDPNRFR